MAVYASVAAVEKRVEDIALMTGDPEAAHDAEDGLWRDVLKACASGVPDAQAMASAALRTLDVEFPRWRA